MNFHQGTLMRVLAVQISRTVTPFLSTWHQTLSPKMPSSGYALAPTVGGCQSYTGLPTCLAERAHPFEILSPINCSFKVFCFPCCNFIRPTILENFCVGLGSLQQRVHFAMQSPTHAHNVIEGDYYDVM